MTIKWFSRSSSGSSNHVLSFRRLTNKKSITLHFPTFFDPLHTKNFDHLKRPQFFMVPFFAQQFEDFNSLTCLLQNLSWWIYELDSYVVYFDQQMHAHLFHHEYERLTKIFHHFLIFFNVFNQIHNTPRDKILKISRFPGRSAGIPWRISTDPCYTTKK